VNTDLMKLVNIISQIGGDSKQYQGDSGSSPGISFSQLLAKQTPVTLSDGSEHVSLKQILPEIDGLMEKIGHHTQTPEFLKELAVQWGSAPGEKTAIVSEYSQEQLLHFLKNLQTTEFSVQQLTNPAAGSVNMPPADPRPVTDVLARHLNSTFIAKDLKPAPADQTFNSHSVSTKEHLRYLQNHTQLTPAIQITLPQGAESRPSGSFEQVRLMQFLQGLPHHKGDSDTLAKSLRQWIESAQPEGKPLVRQTTPVANQPVFDDNELLNFAKINGINPDVAATILATTQAPSPERQLTSLPVSNYRQPQSLLRDDALIAISEQATQELKLTPDSETVNTTLLAKATNNGAGAINSSPTGIELTQQSTANPTVITPAPLQPELTAKAMPGSAENPKSSVTNPAQRPPEIIAQAPKGTAENPKPTATNPAQRPPEIIAQAPKGTAENPKPSVTNPAQRPPDIIAQAPKGTAENPKPSVTNPAQRPPEIIAQALKGTAENPKPTVTNPAQRPPEIIAQAPKGTVENPKSSITNPAHRPPEIIAQAPKGTAENPKSSVTNLAQRPPEIIAKAALRVTTETAKQAAFTPHPMESTAREPASQPESIKQSDVLNAPKPQTLAQNFSPATDSKRSDLMPPPQRANLQESVNTQIAKASTPLMDDLKKFNNPYTAQLVGNNLSLKQKTSDLPIKSTSVSTSKIISTSTFIENRTKLRDVAINTAIASASLFKSNEIKPTSPKVTDETIALQVTTTTEHGEEKIKETELRRAGDLTRFNLITARNQQHLQSQMSERITQMLRAGQWSADLKLNPENLGLIKVNMVMDKDQLKIMFTSQHHNVRELVESSMPRLRESLAESGINLADTSVGRDSQQQRQPEDHDSGDQFNFRTKTADNNSEESTEAKQRSTHDGELDTFV